MLPIHVALASQFLESYFIDTNFTNWWKGEKMLLSINTFAVGPIFSFQHLCWHWWKSVLVEFWPMVQKNFGIYLRPQPENSIQWMDLFLLWLQDSQVPDFRALYHYGTQSLSLSLAGSYLLFYNEKVQWIRSLLALTFYFPYQLSAAKK